jgi:hypothetical protein
MVALPLKGKTHLMKMLLFRMLSRVGASLHQILRSPRQGYPYKLFGALRGLAKSVLDDSECLYDQLTDFMVKEFGSVAALEGETSRSMLQALALMIETDIATIEARHASTRRLVTVKGTQVRSPMLQAISADWICRQQVIHKADLFLEQQNLGTDDQTKPTKKAKIGKTQKRVKRKRSGGGGAWRAFFHDRAKGIRPTKLCPKELSAQYAALSVEEREKYRRIGAAGTFSHKAGFRAFGKTQKQCASAIVPFLDSDIQHRLAAAKAAAGIEAAEAKEEEKTAMTALVNYRQLDSAPSHHRLMFEDSATSLLTNCVPWAAPLRTVAWHAPADELAKAKMGTNTKTTAKTTSIQQFNNSAVQRPANQQPRQQ